VVGWRCWCRSISSAAKNAAEKSARHLKQKLIFGPGKVFILCSIVVAAVVILLPRREFALFCIFYTAEVCTSRNGKGTRHHSGRTAIAPKKEKLEKNGGKKVYATRKLCRRIRQTFCFADSTTGEMKINTKAEMGGTATLANTPISEIHNGIGNWSTTE